MRHVLDSALPKSGVVCVAALPLPGVGGVCVPILAVPRASEVPLKVNN